MVLRVRCFRAKSVCQCIQFHYLILTRYSWCCVLPAPSLSVKFLLPKPCQVSCYPAQCVTSSTGCDLLEWYKIREGNAQWEWYETTIPQNLTRKLSELGLTTTLCYWELDFLPERLWSILICDNVSSTIRSSSGLCTPAHTHIRTVIWFSFLTCTLHITSLKCTCSYIQKHIHVRYVLGLCLRGSVFFTDWQNIYLTFGHIKLTITFQYCF